MNLEEVRRTGKMGVTVSDWYYGGVSDLRVNGIQVRRPDPNNAEANIPWVQMDSVSNGVPFTVVVPRQARLGTMEVAVHGTTYVEQGTYDSVDVHKQTVDVSVFDLDITPSTAVTDQVIRIEGDGFGPTQCIIEIKVGDENIRRATTGDQVAIGNVADCVRTDSDGTLSNSFKVPHNLKPNTYPVIITDYLNRVGQGQITIPKPGITLDPEASQRGSTVTVIGENFPAEDVVGITYGADPVTVATTDTVGKWRATFKVPVDATIGREYEVVAQSEKKGTGQPRVVTGEDTVSLNAKANHMVPEEILDGDSGSGILRPAADHQGREPAAVHPGRPDHRWPRRRRTGHRRGRRLGRLRPLREGAPGAAAHRRHPQRGTDRPHRGYECGSGDLR